MSHLEHVVPQGYKQTEVGIIPEEWIVQPLEYFTSFISYGFTNPMPTVFDGPPMITARDINQGRIQYSTARCTSEDAYKKLLTPKSKPKVNDLLLTKDGTLGRLALVDREDICINQSVALLRPNSKINPKFFKLLLESPYYQEKMLDDAGGSTIKHIYITIVNKMLLGLPPELQEQTAIANALSDVDALLTELEKLIAKKQAIKTATMQQLLTGKTRLPQFANYTEGEKQGQPKGTKPSELGEIPEDWDVINFAELKDKNDQWAITGGPFGSNLKSSDYTESGVRIIQLQNIGDGVFKNDDFVFTSIEKANELKSCNIYPNEIILSKMGDPVARACLIPEFHSRYLMCSDGIRLKVDGNKHSCKFIFYSLNFPTFRNQALDASTGSTRKRIGLTELKNLLITAPCKEEQTAIATILSDMDSEIQTLEQRLAKTRQIKQGMMQELLTGRTRLLFEKEN
ncbi:hypothetical protein BA893_05815 [Vibrio natriegens]|uniref:restriction endonuclease subunit S n=1 Tax=Vibrio natriegens TaxID=691 RepID=UPI0008043DDB|nr:restriction endonuclease subunit S [Vibrio natriegens]ANQ21205.1 hypothetical protein BA893_05815 [Vibrio natriegens]